MTDEGGLSQTIIETNKKHGRIDGLVLNAGVLDPMGSIDLVENILDS